VIDFRCPVCGSQYFTTVAMESGKPWIRQCRGPLVYGSMGRNYLGCTYTWPATQDVRNGLSNDRDEQE
jgi:hypothetical protein